MNPRKIVRLYEWYKAKTFCCAFFAAAMLTMVAAATIVRFPPVTGQSANVDMQVVYTMLHIFLLIIYYRIFDSVSRSIITLKLTNASKVLKVQYSSTASTRTEYECLSPAWLRSCKYLNTCNPSVLYQGVMAPVFFFFFQVAPDKTNCSKEIFLDLFKIQGPVSI